MSANNVVLDPKLLYQCMCRMAGKYPVEVARKSDIDAIFIWGCADKEWQGSSTNESVLRLAASLHKKQEYRPHIVFPGYIGSQRGQGDTGYPGPYTWSDALKKLGVLGKKLVQTSGKGINTKTEMDDFLELATNIGWKKVVGITLHAHALRAMLGTVKSLKSQKMHLKVFPDWPVMFDQRQPVYGSQGMGPFPRCNWDVEEFDRIGRYMAKGDLSTLEELLQYLDSLYK